MAPPRNSPLPETTSKFVAVPKSTTMRGRHIVKGADAVRNAVGAHLAGIIGQDGQAGFHARLDEQRLLAEVASQNWRRIQSMGGTTEAMTMPGSSRRPTFSLCKRLRIRMPYSSAVCVCRVLMRQWRAARRSARGGERVKRDDRIGVVDIEREQHASSAVLRLSAPGRCRRALCVGRRGCGPEGSRARPAPRSPRSILRLPPHARLAANPGGSGTEAVEDTHGCAGSILVERTGFLQKRL